MLETYRKVNGPLPQASVQPNWHALRRPEVLKDLALTGTTRHWLQRLPVRRRPYRLCTSYPRVANRIAWAWPNEQITAQVLNDLLVDSRGGRMGFPHWITRELRRLQEFNQQHRCEIRREGLLEAAGRVMGL
jgi:hypothetical protein